MVELWRLIDQEQDEAAQEKGHPKALMHEGTDGGAASFASKLGNVGGEGHEHAHEEEHGRPDNVAPKGDPGEVLGAYAPSHHRIEHPHAHLRQLGGHGGQGQANQRAELSGPGWQGSVNGRGTFGHE